jgi:hypothetical protein
VSITASDSPAHTGFFDLEDSGFDDELHDQMAAALIRLARQRRLREDQLELLARRLADLHIGHEGSYVLSAADARDMNLALELPQQAPVDWTDVYDESDAH